MTRYRTNFQATRNERPRKRIYYLRSKGRIGETHSLSRVVERSVHCTDLSLLAVKIRASTRAPAPGKLCPICRKINFAMFFEQNCANRIRHYHLGKLEDIRARNGCAMCRLVSAAYDFADRGMLDVTSKEPIYCNLEPNERNGDGMRVCFAADKTERDFENRGCFQLIRPCVEDSTSRKKPRVTPKWSKAYKGFRGRLIESKQVDFGQVREWLHLCETSHGSTCSRNGLVSSAACKIRLIDVTNRQIVDGTTNNRYLALSYVWGPWRQFCLSKENHGDLRAPHGLKDDKMPTTIKDAFDVVTRLGERYLWVDRLCILVDDGQDKLEQMSNMDLIYSAAVLTIVNASACCDNASIPGLDKILVRSTSIAKLFVEFGSSQHNLTLYLLFTS